jgi:transposase
METPDCPGCRVLAARVLALEAQVLSLQAQLRDLMDKLKPPTAPQAKALPPGPAKKATGKKRGGQPGHPPRLKTWLPPERVTETIELVPTNCSHSDHPLVAQPTDAPPTRFQVAELPRELVKVTEYRSHERTCPCCNTVTSQPIPAEIRVSTLGPRLVATMSYLVGVQGVSKRGVEEILETVCGIPVSLGTIANTEQSMSEALATPYQEAREAVANAPVKGVDETGWKEGGKKRWLWVAATLHVAVFLIHARRSIDGLVHLLGTLKGQFQTDRWKVYLKHLPEDEHQLCWAHLQRNWATQAERSKSAKELANRWFELHQHVFRLWHHFKENQLTREALQVQMHQPIASMASLLSEGSRHGDVVLARFCSRLLEQQVRLWLFVWAEGVEPTNNHTERVQRRAVLWRRRSFGCQSAKGCRFVERLLTVVETLKLQKRNVLDYLEAAVQAQRSGQQAPKLVLVG